MKEFFKDILGYEGIYQVSNFGRVKSLERYAKCKGGGIRPIKEKILKPSITRGGYLQVGLYNGKRKPFKIHKLVAMAFLNHKPCGMKLVVDHRDFARQNNKMDNLRIITHRENSNQKHIKSSSQYIGVSWEKRDKKWRSSICIKGREKYLGRFISELDAANAYQAALSKLI